MRAVGGRIRVVWLTRHENKASTRVRVHQYLPILEADGIDSQCLAWEPSGRLAVARYASAALRLASRSDVVVLQKPCQPRWLLELLRRVNPNIVVDVDDAVWARRNRWPGSQKTAGRFFTAVDSAKLVIAGSGYLRERILERVPGATVVVVPSSVDATRYRPRAHAARDVPVLGWIGSAGSRATPSCPLPGNLADFEPALQGLTTVVRAGKARLRIISDHPLDWPGLEAEFVPWSAETEVGSLQDLDVGIMPLRDDERTRGRCGYKAIQCMGVGLPVIASPVGVAPELIRDGVDGALAEGSDAWISAVGRLADPEVRSRMGGSARQRVEEHLTVQVNAARLARAIRLAGS